MEGLSFGWWGPSRRSLTLVLNDIEHCEARRRTHLKAWSEELGQRGLHGESLLEKQNGAHASIRKRCAEGSLIAVAMGE